MNLLTRFIDSYDRFHDDNKYSKLQFKPNLDCKTFILIWLLFQFTITLKYIQIF